MIAKTNSRSRVSKLPLKDSAHRLRVESLPCLACGLEPGDVDNDSHHIRECFPRTMGRRKGDDIVVPLCRPCHFVLHTHSKTYWQSIARVDPVAKAASLYAETLELRRDAA